MFKKTVAERAIGLRPSPIREVVAKIDECRKRGIEIANLSIGRPNFDTPIHIKESAKTAMDNGLVHYAASQGTVEIREAISARLFNDFKLQVPAGDIIVTIGATEAIHVAIQTIVDAGDEVIVPEPTYHLYEGLTSLAGGKTVKVPTREDEDYILNSSSVEKYITGNTKALILTSPHNPTGQVLETRDLAKFADLASTQDLLVISDDAYNRMIFDGADYSSIANLPGMKERTLIVGTFSKTYAMDGWRIGYLAGPRAIIEQAAKVHQYAVSCHNTFVQAAAVTALNSSQRCVDEMVAELDRRRKFVMTILDRERIPYVRPRGGFFVFPSIKKYGLTSVEMSRFLLEEGRVAVVPGDAFGPSGEGHIRISFSASFAELEKGLTQMVVALGKLQGRLR